MKSIKEKQLAFLGETANYYNSKNRAMAKEGENLCLYTPIKGRSKGCAIGRHIKDKKLCAKLDTMGVVTEKKVFKKLPKKLKKLGQDFLDAIQLLHDYRENWSKTGLSAKGKSLVKRITKQINKGLFLKDLTKQK